MYKRSQAILQELVDLGVDENNHWNPELCYSPLYVKFYQRGSATTKHRP